MLLVLTDFVPSHVRVRPDMASRLVRSDCVEYELSLECFKTFVSCYQDSRCVNLLVLPPRKYPYLAGYVMHTFSCLNRNKVSRSHGHASQPILPLIVIGNCSTAAICRHSIPMACISITDLEMLCIFNWAFSLGITYIIKAIPNKSTPRYCYLNFAWACHRYRHGSCCLRIELLGLLHNAVLRILTYVQSKCAPVAQPPNLLFRLQLSRTWSFWYRSPQAVHMAVDSMLIRPWNDHRQ